MKRIFLLPLILIFLFSCDKYEPDPIAESPNFLLDTFIVNNYKYDAIQLYLEDVSSDTTNPQYNNPELDSTKIDEILKIIQAVYNVNSIVRDTIFNIYQIHKTFCYSYNHISLKVDTNSPEISNMVNGIIPTGDVDLDYLLTTFRFDSIRTFYGYPDFPWLTLFSKGEYNMIPVGSMFNQIPSIIIADVAEGCFPGAEGVTNISYTKYSNYSTIIFSQGFGDCPAGCFYHERWEFEVSNNKAEFIRKFVD